MDAPGGHWRVGGVDGCRAGWLVVACTLLAHKAAALERPFVVPRFADVVSLGLDVVAVDIPIGLPEAAAPGGRRCDREARALLGRPRCTSVFSAPTRAALAAASYAQAKVLNGGMTIQAFNICPKIRDVDGGMTPALQARVIEVHPELSFLELNAGRPVEAPKRRPEGAALRAGLLQAALPGSAAVLAARPRGATRDDVADALAALWSGRRFAMGQAVRVPAEPPRDARALRMEIWR